MIALWMGLTSEQPSVVPLTGGVQWQITWACRDDVRPLQLAPEILTISPDAVGSPILT